jgi:hypothetical protein
MIFGFFARNPDKEARQLAKDAASIIDMAETTYRPELLEEIAEITRYGLDSMQRNCADDEVLRARELDRYKSLHREARRQNAQAKLTAYTLIIINTRALAVAQAGTPACDHINEFLQRWPATEEPEGTLLG